MVRVRVRLVLVLICSITAVNGVSYVVIDYMSMMSLMWCTFQVNPIFSV